MDQHQNTTMHGIDIFGAIRQLLRKLGMVRGNRPAGALIPSGSDADLELRVRRDLAFLFESHGAKVVSNNYYPRSFGNAVLVLQAENIRLRIVKDRRDGLIRVDVAPSHLPEEWEMLEIALSVCTGENRDAISYVAKYDDDPGELTYVGLTEVARLLSPRISALTSGYSPNAYEGVRKAYMNIHGEPWLTSFTLRPGRQYPELVLPKKTK